MISIEIFPVVNFCLLLVMTWLIRRSAKDERLCNERMEQLRTDIEILRAKYEEMHPRQDRPT